jgi:hypothetical protein
LGWTITVTDPQLWGATHRLSLAGLDNLPAPEIIAREIVDDLTAALEDFSAAAAALEATVTKRDDLG